MYAVEYYPPGKLPDICRAGDVGLTVGRYRIARKIRELQGVVYAPEYAAFGHMFCVQNNAGLISEALEFGVEAEHISKYEDDFFAIINVCQPRDIRELATNFGWEVLKARPRYSYETIALMYVQLRAAWVAQKVGYRKRENGFDFPVTFQRTNTSICSGYGAEWLSKMGRVWPRGSAYVMPARAAHDYGVRYEGVME